MQEVVRNLTEVKSCEAKTSVTLNIQLLKNSSVEDFHIMMYHDT